MSTLSVRRLCVLNEEKQSLNAKGTYRTIAYVDTVTRIQDKEIGTMDHFQADWKIVHNVQYGGLNVFAPEKARTYEKDGEERTVWYRTGGGDYDMEADRSLTPAGSAFYNAVRKVILCTFREKYPEMAAEYDKRIAEQTDNHAALINVINDSTKKRKPKKVNNAVDVSLP